MILNLRGIQQANSLVFTMPNITFDNRLKYKIGVHRAHIIHNGENKIEDNELLQLTSNLVDRSAVNPDQTLLFFNNHRSSNNIQSHKSNIVLYYDLNLYELENASFAIKRFTGDTLRINISLIFLQLEIVRKQAYGRF